jgi:hypothetical protein
VRYGRFRSVERHVGVVHDFLEGAFCEFRRKRESHADGYGNELVRRLDWAPRNFLSQIFRPRDGASGIAHVQGHQKFLGAATPTMS